MKAMTSRSAIKSFLISKPGYLRWGTARLVMKFGNPFSKNAYKTFNTIKQEVKQIYGTNY